MKGRSRFAVGLALWCLVGLTPLAGAFWSSPEARSAQLQTVWEYRLGAFDEVAYTRAVEQLIVAFEQSNGQRLVPRDRGKAGLKVYSNSGRGLATPAALVEAVAVALEKRGFARSDILLFDVSEHWLRDAGFLPALSRRAEEGNFFRRLPILPLDSGRYYSPEWTYDNPLPTFNPLATRSGELESTRRAVEERTLDDNDRLSPLPAPLLLEVDFWINLPAVLDHPSTGLAGAIVNASLWAVGNRERFLASSENGPVAAAEIAAIPEYLDHWAFTILPLERYQIIGGPVFNSLYTRSEPLLWLSANPVVLDGAMLVRLNRERRLLRFPELEEDLPLLRYAESVGLGPRRPDRVEWRSVGQ